MRRMWLLVLASAVALSSAATAAGQDVFRGGVDLISVDVVVLDRTGRPIADLTPADFDVTVSGRKDGVKALYYVDRAKAVAEMSAAPAATSTTTAAVASPGASSVRRPYTGRSILIGVNDISFRGLDAGPYVADLAEWVKTLDAADSVAVMTGSFRVAAPFSRDRAKTVETLRDAAAGQMDEPHTGDIRLSIREARAVDENVGNSLDVFLGMLTNGAVPEDARIAWARECPDRRDYTMCFLRFRNEAQDTARLMDDFRMRSVQAVKVFLETLRSAPPPRVLVLLAGGAPIDDRTQFRDAIREAGDAGAQVFIVTPEANRASTASDRSHTFSGQDIPDGARMLNAGDGKSMAAMRYEDDEYLKTGLDRVADETGGRVFRVTTSATPALARIGDGTSGFYRLGLSVPPELAKSESVPLKIVVKRGGARLTAPARLRFSTVVESPEPVMVAGGARPSAPAASPSPAVAPRISAFPVEFSTAVQRADAGDQIRVVIAATAASASAGPMKVAVTFADGSGQIVKSAGAELAADADGHRGAFAVNVPPGDYRMRVLATDGDGREGWADRDIAVTLRSLGGIPASDVLLSSAGGDRVFRRMPDERVPAGAEYLVASVELYPAPAVTVPSLNVVVTSADGVRVHDDELEMDTENGKTIARVLISIDVLKAGRYEVRVEPRGASASAEGVSTAIAVGAR